MRSHLTIPLLALLLFAPQPAGAALGGKGDWKKKDRIDVFQLRSVLKKKRHEFQPFVGVTVNDSYVNTFAVGLAYTYHISEYFGIEGVVAGYALAGLSTLSDRLRNGQELGTSGTAAQKFNPETAKTRFFVTPSLVWTPFFGKFSIGGSGVIQTEFYLTAGAGLIVTNRDKHFCTTFGFGWRTFLTRWLVLKIDLRDHAYTQKLLETSVLTHNLFLSVGVGFYVPTGFTYSHQS